MILQIVSNTPLWVWALLLGLLVLGGSQLLPRVTSQGRVLRVALGMTAFSLYGTVSAFHASVPALAAWAGAALVVGWVTLAVPLSADTRYLAERRAFALPGSVVPLALMLGVFAVKYVAGVLAGMHAPLVETAMYAPVLGMIYGAFSGAFLGRAGRLLRLARQAQAAAWAGA